MSFRDEHSVTKYSVWHLCVIPSLLGGHIHISYVDIKCNFPTTFYLIILLFYIIFYETHGDMFWKPVMSDNAQIDGVSPYHHHYIHWIGHIPLLSLSINEWQKCIGKKKIPSWPPNGLESRSWYNEYLVWIWRRSIETLFCRVHTRKNEVCSLVAINVTNGWWKWIGV